VIFAGEALQAPKAHPPSFSAEVVAVTTGYDAELIVRRGDREERRQLHLKDCDSLVEAIALVMTLTLEPGSEELSEAPVAPASPSNGSPMPPPPLPTVPFDGEEGLKGAPAGNESAATTPRRPGPRLGVEVMWHVGELPGAGPGLGGQLSLPLGATAELLVDGWYLTEQRTYPSEYSGGLGVSLWLGALRPCLHQPWGGRVCAGLELGRMRARGIDLEEEAHRSAVWVAPVLSAGWRAWTDQNVSLALDAELVVPLYRQRFGIVGPGGQPDPWYSASTAGRLLCSVDFGI